MRILVRPTIQTAVGLYLGISWIELLKGKLSYIKIFLRVDVSIYQFESSNAKQEVGGSILPAGARLGESAEAKKGTDLIGCGLVQLVVVLGCPEVVFIL